MQSGCDTSRLRLADCASSAHVDIYEGQRPATEGKSSDFFGGDGLSFRDVLDAINPLNHLPVVSDLMKEATGHEVSTASRLVGGTLLGGPIGFIASLAGIIFESATGQSPVNAVYAALTGDAPDAPVTEIASNDAMAVQPPEILADSGDMPVQIAALVAPVSARAVSSHGAVNANAAILDLYGNSPVSAHRSYQKAQMLPYLRDVTTSQIL